MAPERDLDELAEKLIKTQFPETAPEARPDPLPSFRVTYEGTCCFAKIPPTVSHTRLTLSFIYRRTQRGDAFEQARNFPIYTFRRLITAPL